MNGLKSCVHVILVGPLKGKLRRPLSAHIGKIYSVKTLTVNNVNEIIIQNTLSSFNSKNLFIILAWVEP